MLHILKQREQIKVAFMQKSREDQIRGLSTTASVLVIYHKSTKQPKYSVAMCEFPEIPSFLVGFENLLLIQNLKYFFQRLFGLLSTRHPVILYYLRPPVFISSIQTYIVCLHPPSGAGMA
jgi:hypothetical protein